MCENFSADAVGFSASETKSVQSRRHHGPVARSTWDLVAMLDYFANNGIPVRIAQVIVTDMAEENAVGPSGEKIDEAFGRRARQRPTTC